MIKRPLTFWSVWHTAQSRDLEKLKNWIRSRNSLRRSGMKYILNAGFYFVATKGQLISKCPFGVFKSPQKPTNFL